MTHPSNAAGVLEHVNVAVSRPERTAKLLCTLFDWHIRWQGPAKAGGQSIHVGSDSCYVALYSGDPSGQAPAPSAQQRLQHIAIVVTDLDGVEERVKAAGYHPHLHGNYEPGRRFYFSDDDDIEFEIVSYN